MGTNKSETKQCGQIAGLKPHYVIRPVRCYVQQYYDDET